MRKLLLLSLLFSSCSSDPATKNLRLSDDTFVSDETVYKIVDNQVLSLGALDDSVKLFSIYELDSVRNLGFRDLDFVKDGVAFDLSMIHRGSILYYKITLVGFQNDHDDYYGVFSISFLDEFGFVLHEEAMPLSGFVGVITDGKVGYHTMQGKLSASSDMYNAIAKYNISSTVIKRSSKKYY